MKSIRKIKCMTLIIAIIIPMMMVFSSFITTAKADTSIPVDNYGDNQWHWGVDEGDMIMWEMEVSISDPVTGKLDFQMKDLMILNISSIANITKLGLEYSHVNMTNLYYNSTFDTLVPSESPISSVEFALDYSANATINYDYKMMPPQSIVPMILPLNSSGVIEWDNITTILNDTVFTNLAQMGFEGFDDFGFNRTDDSFWFRNYTSGSYFEAGYYNSHPTVKNGTLKWSKISMIAPFGTGPMLLNSTGVQVFDYNVTDELEWGVDVGDTFIYDFAEKHHDDYYNETYNNTTGPKDKFAGEIKIVVSKFNDTTFWLKGNGFGGENETNSMVFQGVYADVYYWNFTLDIFVLEMSNYLVGAANNFYPVLMREEPQFVIPTSATQADFEYMFNPDLLKNRNMSYDDVSIVWGNIIRFKMWNSTGTEIVEIRINSTNGVFLNYFMSSDWDFSYFVLKNMTFIDWAVGVGDVIYFKENGGEGEREIRVTVKGFGTFFDNLSFYFEEFLDVPLPAGQPELQFFSVVMGIVHHWNPENETWVPEYNPNGLGGPGPGPTTGPMFRPIAAANKYWAIAPPMLTGGPPILLPNGTTGFDPEFQNLFDLMSNWYDDISYGLNWAVLKNTTANKGMYYNFSATTGMTTYIGGWMYTYDDYYGYASWSYFSTYNEMSVDLVPTLNTINLQSLWVSDISITAEISVSAPGAKFIYALNALNPVNVPLPMGDELLYFDLKITDHSLLTANITLEATLPSYVNLSTKYLYFFPWGMENSYGWGGAPQEFYDSISYNYTANSVRFEIPIPGPIMLLVGVSYGTEPPVTEPADFTLTSDAGNPDEDGDFVLSWTESTGADSYTIYASPTFISGETELPFIYLETNITDLTYSITGLPNGTYYFIVVAHNFAGDTLSNCLEVSVGTGAADFTLTSDAGNPDEDGNFVLSWTESTGADSYTVYVSPTFISSESQLPSIYIATNITDLTYAITGFINGTWYFVVVAHNIAGNTLSNCLEVIVGSGVISEEEIPGYNLLIVLVALISVSAIIIKKRRKL